MLAAVALGDLALVVATSPETAAAAVLVAAAGVVVVWEEPASSVAEAPVDRLLRMRLLSESESLSLPVSRGVRTTRGRAATLSLSCCSCTRSPRLFAYNNQSNPMWTEHPIASALATIDLLPVK